VGVRPEHLVIERNPESATKNVIKGTVEVVEPQGATSILQNQYWRRQKDHRSINEQWGRVAGEKSNAHGRERTDSFVRSGYR